MDVLVNIDVDDLDGAVTFYVEALGLHVGRRFEASVVELLGGSSAIYLLCKGAGTSAASTAIQRRDYRRHWTPVHLDFVVPDIDAACAKAEAAGALREGQIKTHAWGRIVQLADPFGHGLCLIQFHGRGYDEIANGPKAQASRLAQQVDGGRVD